MAGQIRKTGASASLVGKVCSSNWCWSCVSRAMAFMLGLRFVFVLYGMACGGKCNRALGRLLFGFVVLYCGVN